MKLVPYEISKLGSIKGYSNNRALLQEFVESDLDCVKVEGFTQKEARYCASSLSNSVKRYRIANVKVITRKNEVFLVKKTSL